MKDLLTRALDAHGGLSRWRQIEAFQLKVSIGGGLWRLKGLPDGLRSCISTRKDRVVTERCLRVFSCAMIVAPCRVEDWNYTFQPWPVDARPTVSFKTDKTLKFDGETIVMKNFGPGHTDGDLSVYFQRADVLVLGDTFWNGIYPFIDNEAGGGIDGMIRWVDAALTRATDKTIIVSGHGPVGDKAQLAEFRDMLAAIRENVYRLKKQGRSLDEIIAAKPTAAYDDKWASSLSIRHSLRGLFMQACERSFLSLRIKNSGSTQELLRCNEQSKPSRGDEL